MKLLKLIVPTLMICMFLTMPANAASVSLGLSGPGAVNDSTIKVGEKVSIDIILENDSVYAGFTLGFSLSSPDIAEVIHVADTAGGANERGDVKGYGGFEDRSIWDLAGLFVVERDWDGKLPDLLGFGGVCVKQRYNAHEKGKRMSFDLIVPEAGTLVIDSAFFPPGGNWMYSPPAHEPDWDGPYNFKVVK